MTGHKVDAAGGERLDFNGMQFVIRACAESTDGAFSITEEIEPVDVPAHIHDRNDEAFYILDGEHLFTVGDSEFRVHPGDLVFGPRGVPHARRPVVPRSGRILTMFSPAGFEQFFRDLVAADRDGQLGPEAMDRIAALHGARWV